MTVSPVPISLPARVIDPVLTTARARLAKRSQTPPLKRPRVMPRYNERVSDSKHKRNGVPELMCCVDPKANKNKKYAAVPQNRVLLERLAGPDAFSPVLLQR